MRDIWEIEDIILGIADIVKENRALRQANNELKMECEKYKAYFYGDLEKGKILSDITIHNASVMSCESMGWLTNQEYIDDWEIELKRRLQIKNKEETK